MLNKVTLTIFSIISFLLLVSQMLFSPTTIIQQNHYIYFSKESNTFVQKSPSKISDIVIFFHVKAKGAYWYTQAKYIENALIESGLLEKSRFAFLYFIEGAPLRGQQKFHSKFKVFSIKATNDVGEFPTLQSIYAFCLHEENFNILYLRNQGAQKLTPAIKDWVDLMLYFNIYRWEETVQLLEKNHSIACVNWKLEPSPHCEGNFWWAKSDYIRTLPYPYPLFMPPNKEIGGAKTNGEFWIGKNFKDKDPFLVKQSVCQLHSSNGVLHYINPYFFENYVTNSSLSCL